MMFSIYNLFKRLIKIPQNLIKFNIEIVLLTYLKIK